MFSLFCSALLIRLITSQYAETESALLKDITARLFLLHARNNRSLRLFSYSISVSDVRNANVSFRYSFKSIIGIHAVIKSYIETCHRNGINEIDALQRLASGKPYTVKEIFQLNIN